MQNTIAVSAPSDFAFSLPALLSVRRYATQPNYLLLRRPPTRDVEELWQDFLGRVKFPDLYITPHIFFEPYWRGKNVFVVLAMHDGQVTGVLTGLDEGEQVTCGLPARPQLLVDPASQSRRTAETLAKALVSEFPRSRLTTAYSWSSTLASEFERQHFRVRQLEGDVVLELRPGAEALFQSFHDNRKRNIRAAIRNGVEISEVSTAQDLSDYWDVYCAWRKTERKTIHANGNFDKAAEVHRLRTTHRRFLTVQGYRAIAATTVRFYPGGLIEYSANCSIDEFNRFRPNDLLIWWTIQWACDQGFSRYSLGAAHPFLRKCGGVVVPIYRYRLDRTFLHQVEIRERAADMGRLVLQNFRESKSVARKCFRSVVAA